MGKAANEFSLEELEALFQDETMSTTPSTEPATEPSVEPELKGKEGAKIVANKINEERATIAKQMGYGSYEEMLQSANDRAEAEKKAKEAKLIEDRGYDPKDLEPVVDEIVKQRLAETPEMKELAEFRRKQAEEYGQKQLAEITKLTGGAITKLEQIPQNVVDLWTKTGDLKGAYLQLEGENLILKARSAQSKGSTAHLQSPSGNSPAPATHRNLTEEEKQVWRQMLPTMTEKELNEKTVPKE